MRRAGWLLVLPLLACASRGAAGPEHASASQPLNGPPLSFEVKRYPSGEPFHLESERGQVVLLDVWATWCPPCRDSLPLYQRLEKELGPKGLRVFALSVDADPQEIPPFVQETKLTLPILLDSSGAVADKVLHVRGVPTSFMIDRAGVVRQLHEGLYEEPEALYAKLKSEAGALLAEPAPH